MRGLTLLLTLLAKYRSNAEVKLWLMWKNYFLKTMHLGKHWKEKENFHHKYCILPQTNSLVIKNNQNIYHYEIVWWLTCQFQVNFSLLNPLQISENQKFRFSDIFKGYRHGKLAWHGFWKKNFSLGFFLLINHGKMRSWRDFWSANL